MFGVAVLAPVFSANGSYVSPSAYVAGLVPAVWVGAAIVALAAVTALAIPGRIRVGASEPVRATSGSPALEASGTR
ncbi:MAG: hypothetical protein E6H96_13230 [Chloroflexi bacterium]|nr:MAG: hypothetical protein E6H96_13230 [Chloroflexota bacterium]